MATVKLENVSFNKLKEFTSLGSKKNTTIKGKFTLIGEYELITKDGGDDMTLCQLTKFTTNFVKKQETFNHEILNRIDELSMTIKQFAKIMMDEFAKVNARINKIEKRLDNLENLVHTVIKVNNLKTK